MSLNGPVFRSSRNFNDTLSFASGSKPTSPRVRLQEKRVGARILPQDAALDLAHTSFSPGVRRLMGRVGGKSPLAKGVGIWKS